MAYKRQANNIRNLDTNEVQTFPSINKAKRHSRALTAVSVVPHRRTAKHIPNNQPVNIRKRG